MMNVTEIAAALNGRQYRDEITPEIRAAAKAANILILHGASDDLLEFDGALFDEHGAWNGATLWLTPDGLTHSHRKPSSIQIAAQWCPKDLDTSWLITSDAPFTSFDIMEDDDLYCRGAVIDLNEAFSSPEVAS